MFEAKILQGSLLKKIIEAIRELVVDANLDCNERGISMQVSNRNPSQVFTDMQLKEKQQDITLLYI